MEIQSYCKILYFIMETDHVRRAFAKSLMALQTLSLIPALLGGEKDELGYWRSAEPTANTPNPDFNNALLMCVIHFEEKRARGGVPAGWRPYEARRLKSSLRL